MEHVLRIATLLLLASPAWAAQDLNGSSDVSASTSVEVTAPPFTLCGWFKSDSATAAQQIFSVSTANGNADSFRLQLRSSGGGSTLAAVSTASSVTTLAESVAYTSGVWQHGCAVFATTSSRSAYLNGGDKGTDTTANSPAAMTRTTLGGLRTADTPTYGTFFDGAIMEVGVWSVVLTDAEVATLAKGFAPPCVRRMSLVSYYPAVFGGTVGEITVDRFTTANNLTLTGGTRADNGRVINCQ